VPIEKAPRQRLANGRLHVVERVRLLLHRATAGLRATMACLGAALAVIAFVLAAFVGASFADLRAQAARRVGEVTSTGDETCGQSAYRGAVRVQCDAADHHRDVRFLETGGGAMVTGDSALLQRFDAGLGLMHGDSSSMSTNLRDAASGGRLAGSCHRR